MVYDYLFYEITVYSYIGNHQSNAHTYGGGLQKFDISLKPRKILNLKPNPSQSSQVG